MEPVRIPQLGLTTSGGTLGRWCRVEGERIEPGDVLFELETDKATVEVEAESAGWLRGVRLRPGESAAVGEIVAWLAATPDEEAPAAEDSPGTAPQPRATETPAPAPPSAATSARPAASPYARRLAAEAGLDWRRIAPSGPGGRVVARDVLAAMRPGTATARNRQAVAQRTALGAASPQFPASRRVDLSLTSAWLRARAGAGIGYTDLFLQASLRALRQVPQLHARYRDGAIEFSAEARIGLATATPQGLIVPLLHLPFDAGLSTIAAARRAVVERARSGRLQANDVGDPTFTLSNLGPLGVDRFVAILDPAQAAVLAVGAVRDAAVVRDGNLAVAPCCELTLTVDHRVGDGADAAAFLAVLAAYCERAEGLQP